LRVFNICGGNDGDATYSETGSQDLIKLVLNRRSAVLGASGQGRVVIWTNKGGLPCTVPGLRFVGAFHSLYRVVERYKYS
jgi:hypothetical protein